MAVYTEVSAEELDALLARYDIGDLMACKGIAEGVENSNFFLGTNEGQFILTLYEKRVAPDDLPFIQKGTPPGYKPPRRPKILPTD